jgi:acyl-CoA synthetase (AMP-forming)/AMP-acid ligase II
MNQTQSITAILKDVAKVGTLGQLLARAALQDGDHLAVISEDTRVSYSQLLDDARMSARGLLALGVNRGDHVGIFMPNGVRFLQTLFGVLMIGAVVVPIHSRFRADELRHIARHGDLRVILTSGGAVEVGHPSRLLEAFPEFAETVGSDGINCDEFPNLRFIVGFDAPTVPSAFVSEDFYQELAAMVSESELDNHFALVHPDDVAMILYTSGTTAHPKGCVHTHRGLIRNGITMGRTRFFLTTEDRLWDPLPMFHVGFLLPLIAVVNARATMLIMGKVDGGVALDMIERERATWLFPAFPAVVNALLDHPTFAQRDLSSVRMTMCTGTSTLLRRLQAAIPSSVQISTYGSTETGGVIVYGLPSDMADVRATTCGTPMPGNEIRIADLGSSEPVPPGVIGEILVRGYSVLTRYYKDEQATRTAIDDQGWFHTGDLGVLDEGDRLSYQGRSSEMLKVGGENVSPLEVETIIGELPAVAIVQVVGAPDERLEEVVAAFIQVKEGLSISQDDVIAFCQGRIAGFKVPKLVRFVDEWPMSTTKIQRKELRERIVEEMSLTDDGTTHPGSEQA